jgi:transcriptional regulator with XRE-family HTH domain
MIHTVNVANKVCAIDNMVPPFIHNLVLSSPPRAAAATPAMPPIYGAMGRVLRDAREQVGRTQEDVARAVSLTRTSLTNIEKGRQKLLLHTFADIAKFLGHSPGALLAQILTKEAEQSPSLTIPTNLSRKAHDQISGMIDGSPERPNHATPPPPPHSRKSRNAPR